MKLNIQDIKYIIQESTRRILAEITVRDARLKHYQDIPQQDWMEIIQKLQGNNVNKLEGETRWALELYRRKSPRFMEDLYKLHNGEGDGYLDIFKRLVAIHKLKGNEGNLYQYKSIADLGAFVTNKLEELGDEEIWGDNAYRKKKNMNDAQKSAKDDCIRQYEDDEWLVITPKSYEASVYWGDDTEWCTAYKDSRHFYDSYTQDGPLYININKNTDEKYQFHFESGSFMDRYDRDIKKPVLENIGASDGLRNFYKKVTINDARNPESYLKLCAEENEGLPYDIYNIGDSIWFYNMEDDIAKELTDIANYGWNGWEQMDGFYSRDPRDYLCTLENTSRKYNFINGYGNIISDIWFDAIGDWEYEYCYIPVKVNGKWGIMGNYGSFEIEPKYDNILDIRDYYGRFKGYKVTLGNNELYVDPDLRNEEPYNPEIHGETDY